LENVVGYRVFFRYLELIWEEEKSDCLAVLLGDMSLLRDGVPTDTAYVSDWNRAVASVPDRHDIYKIGIQFLTIWLAIGYDAGVDKVRLDMESNNRLDLWYKAINDVLNNKDDVYLHFC
jgi:hypothetical protein